MCALSSFTSWVWVIIFKRFSSLVSSALTEGTQNATAAGPSAHLDVVCEASGSRVAVREIGFPADRHDDHSRQHNRPGKRVKRRSTFRLRRLPAAAGVRVVQVWLPLRRNRSRVHLGADDADGDERPGRLLHDIAVQRRHQLEGVQAAVRGPRRNFSCKPKVLECRLRPSSFDLNLFSHPLSEYFYDFIFSVFLLFRSLTNLSFILWLKSSKTFSSNFQL